MLPNREQIENAKFSLNRCVLNKVAANSLFGKRGNFRSLSILHPRIVDRLKKEHTGYDIKKEKEELQWLSRLPKAELHCHLGGILNPEAMVIIAGAEIDRINDFCRDYHEYQDWLTSIGNLVKNKDVEKLRQIALNKVKYGII